MSRMMIFSLSSSLRANDISVCKHLDDVLSTYCRLCDTPPSPIRCSLCGIATLTYHHYMSIGSYYWGYSLDSLDEISGLYTCYPSYRDRHMGDDVCMSDDTLSLTEDRMIFLYIVAHRA